MNNTDHISTCIENLDFNLENYKKTHHPKIKIMRPIGNHVYHKSISRGGSININFGEGVNSIVFVGENFSGSLDILIRRSNCVVYVGDNADLKQLSLRLRSDQSRVFIGEGVSTSGPNLWVNCSENPRVNDIVVGDHCMFSFDITLRNDDQHPVYDTTSWDRINVPKANLIIEPYCWIGHRATLLKNVSIGACSIVGSGAVVTKSAPRFSALAGAPAEVRDIQGRIWSRGTGKSREMAYHYLQRYAKPGSFVIPDTPLGAIETESDD